MEDLETLGVTSPAFPPTPPPWIRLGVVDWYVDTTAVFLKDTVSLVQSDGCNNGSKDCRDVT